MFEGPRPFKMDGLVESHLWKNVSHAVRTVELHLWGALKTSWISQNKSPNKKTWCEKKKTDGFLPQKKLKDPENFQQNPSVFMSQVWDMREKLREKLFYILEVKFLPGLLGCAFNGRLRRLWWFRHRRSASMGHRCWMSLFRSFFWKHKLSKFTAGEFSNENQRRIFSYSYSTNIVLDWMDGFKPWNIKWM